MAAPATAQPLTLKCGITVRNRLVKAAMAENMATPDGLPPQKMARPYSTWARGGWGMVLTGNVQINSKYLGQASDVSLNESITYQKQLEEWKAWAAACDTENVPTIVQINHPGRQSPPKAGSKGFFDKNVSSSAVLPLVGPGLFAWALSHLAFGTPKELSIDEIKDVVRQFAMTAKLAAEAGFAGIQIHAAHGYLLTQFMSAKVNRRTDKYGGSPAARVKIVLEIIEAIREVTPKNFCVGIKVNSVDQSSAELSDCIEQIKLIASAGVDFLEVSGGSMEDPSMFLGKKDQEKISDRTRAREAFFLEFARTIRGTIPDVPLMVTGGFRTRLGIENAISWGDCDMAGLARPAVMNPALPSDVIFNENVSDEDAKFPIHKVEPSPWLDWLGLRSVGAGAASKWYGDRIRSM